MRVKILDSFSEKLGRQVQYIAEDKPQAAHRFRKAIIARIRTLNKHPFKCRRSIYSDDENVRNLIFKGYVITFKIDLERNEVVVFARKSKTWKRSVDLEKIHEPKTADYSSFPCHCMYPLNS